MLSARKKAEAIFEAMKKYGDYQIFVTINDKTCVVCHAVSMKHVFVSHYNEPNAMRVWFEDVKNVTACSAYKETKWMEDEIEIF